MKTPTTFQKSRRAVFAAALFMLLPLASANLGGVALAKKDPVYTGKFSNAAAGGYDVTAYFSESRPVKGNSKFTAKYRGAKWSFASKENMEKFLADPEKYAPQYGGYCAWAVAQGNTASGDPLLWTVHGGKLYLNYNKKINDRWSRDKDSQLAKSDENCPEVLH